MRTALLKRAFAAVLLLTLTAPFWDIGRPLWEIDDARYAEIPREMAESGDWVTPRLNYLEYVEKPPFLYWTGALSYKVFGPGEAAGRLPNALLALLGLAAVLWLGTRLFSRRTGLAAVLILGTSLQYFAFEHYLTPDMAVSVFLLWATGLILLTLREPGSGARRGTLAWAAMAAGFFSKGLIALVLPGIWTVSLLALFPELRKGLRPLLFNWGLPFFFATTGAWLLLMESRNPGFLRFFIVEQHFTRFLTSHFNRPGTWHYFIPVVLVGTLPWTPLTLWGGMAPLLSWRKGDPRRTQLAAWAAVVFVFFSFSESKLISYVLPIFPHLALLGARQLEELDESPRARSFLKRAGMGLGVLMAAAGAAAPFVVKRLALPIAVSPDALAFGALTLAALGGGLCALGWDRRGEEGAMLRLTTTGACALALCLFLTAGTRQFEGLLSVKRLALAAKERIERLEPDSTVRLFCYDFLPHGLVFYTARPVDMLNWTGELEYAKRSPANAGRFGSIETLWRVPAQKRRALVVFPRKEMASFSRWVPEDQVRRLTQFDRWVLAEL